MKFIDLFAGIGGFHYGFERANDIEEAQSKSDKESWTNSSDFNRESSAQGRSKPAFSCVWANEFNKYAASIYKKRFPKTVLSTADIRTVNANEIPSHDLLCAGFPCQAFSIAGKRKGFNDTRGTLFFEIARILKAKRPRLFLLENVKGLLSHEEGRTFATILSTLQELGYWVEWQVLNSKDFSVPQNRERVFIAGHLGRKGEQAIFPIRQSSKVSVGKNGETQKSRQGVCSTLRAGYSRVQGGGETYIQEGSGLMELTEGKSQGYRVYSPEGVASTIAGNAGGVGAKTGLYEVGALRSFPRTNNPEQDKLNGRSQRVELRKDGVSNTLSSVEKDNYVFGNKQIRRLTPVECERLQAFPDNWTEGLSDTQRYKCLGNAVTTNVIQAIGEKIKECD